MRLPSAKITGQSSRRLSLPCPLCLSEASGPQVFPRQVPGPVLLCCLFGGHFPAQDSGLFSGCGHPLPVAVATLLQSLRKYIFPWTSVTRVTLGLLRHLCRSCKSGARFVRSQGVTVPLWTAGEFILLSCIGPAQQRLLPRAGLSDWLRIFHQRQAWALHLLRHLSQQIKVSVGNDKTAYLSRMAAIANAAAENSNTKLFNWAVKRLKKFRPKPLRGVFLEDGELAKSPEDVAARWQRHFSSALAGTPVPLEDISRGILHVLRHRVVLLRRRSSGDCY